MTSQDFEINIIKEPSIWQRFRNFGHRYSNDVPKGNVIELEHQPTINLMSNETFATICREMAIKSLYVAKKFDWTDKITKFLAAALCMIISYVTIEDTLDMNVIIPITIVNIFLISSDSIGNWSKQSEKYARLYEVFSKLPSSNSIHRQDKFRKMVNFYENAGLYYDILKTHNDNLSLFPELNDV